MTEPADKLPESLTPKDISLSAELGQQVNLLKQFLNLGRDKSLQTALSICEWTIRPGDDGAPLLEIRCFSCGSWRQVVGKSVEIANQLRQAAGPAASVLIHRPPQAPEVRNGRYLFHLYRDCES